MEKVKLTYVNSEKKTSRQGNEYTSVGIKIESKPDTWINGFGNAQTANWNVGDEFELDIYQEEYNGKMYWKFKLPKTGEALVELNQRVECLEESVNALLRAVKPDMGAKEAPVGDGVKEYNPPTPEPPPPEEDPLPF